MIVSRKFIPTKHLCHSDPFPVHWTWMTCLFLNSWECDVWSKIQNLAIHHQFIHLQNYLMTTVFWKKSWKKRWLFFKIIHRWLLIGSKNEYPDSKNTQNLQSLSRRLYYVRAFTGWPMLTNAGNSFETREDKGDREGIPHIHPIP